MKYPNSQIHPLQSIEEIIEYHKEKPEPLLNLPKIADFYADQEILITGGSGFIGKVLIEKLLRSCPNIKKIYLLLRSKKGKNLQERLDEIVEQPLFEILRAVNPEFFLKIAAVSGDITEMKLGLSDEDVERMKNVSIIFHSAASVRFDDSLKYSILMNTRGTREVMKFAENLNNIKVIMHVSTAYSNVYMHTLEEKIYPPAADWKKTIEVCEKLEEDQLDFFTQHYIGFMPNTYVFSKNLAEHVSNDYKEKLPIVLFRPSVVVGAFKEPFPGWVDNFNGPMGILLASVLGLSKTMYCDPKNILDLSPVDVCVKAMIIAAWKRAHEPEHSLPVYNCAAGKKTQLTIKQILDIGINGVCKEIPMEHMIFNADGGVTLCKPWNMIRVLIYQIIPASIIDFGLKVSNKKPKLMKIQRKMFEANKALSYFVTNNWDFKNDNYVNLTAYLRPEDVKEFEYRDSFTSDMVLNIRNYVLGFRRYLLKEDDASLPKCREKYKRLEILNRVLGCVPYLTIFYISFIKYDVIELLKSQF